MLAGAGILAIGMLVGPNANGLASLMPLWFVLGLGYSLAQTPMGRLLRRSAHAEDRPALFAGSSRCRMPAGSSPIRSQAGSVRWQGSTPRS
jgi:hypothetical protein